VEQVASRNGARLAYQTCLAQFMDCSLDYFMWLTTAIERHYPVAQRILTVNSTVQTPPQQITFLFSLDALVSATDKSDYACCINSYDELTKPTDENHGCLE